MGNDLALVMFGRGTFGAVAEIGSPEDVLEDKSATIVGCDCNYAICSGRSLQYFKASADEEINLIESPADVFNPEDKGGPWSLEIEDDHKNKTYKGVGVTSARIRGGVIGAFIGPDRSESLQFYLNHAQHYCVTGYKRKDFKGCSWSVCNEKLGERFSGQLSPSDPFTMYKAWKHSN